MAVTVCPTYDTLQPAMVPLSAAVGDRPVGSVSLTVTSPVVGPEPATFETVIVYVSAASPCLKLPLWLLLTAR